MKLLIDGGAAPLRRLDACAGVKRSYTFKRTESRTLAAQELERSYAKRVTSVTCQI